MDNTLIGMIVVAIIAIAVMAFMTRRRPAAVAQANTAPAQPVVVPPEPGCRRLAGVVEGIGLPDIPAIERPTVFSRRGVTFTDDGGIHSYRYRSETAADNVVDARRPILLLDGPDDRGGRRIRSSDIDDYDEGHSPRRPRTTYRRDREDDRHDGGDTEVESTRRSDIDPAEQRRTVFLRGVPFTGVRKEDVRRFAEVAGVPIEDVTLPLKPDGNTRGFAFVILEREEDLDRAVNVLNGKKLSGREIVASPAGGDRPHSTSTSDASTRRREIAGMPAKTVSTIYVKSDAEREADAKKAADAAKAAITAKPKDEVPAGTASATTTTTVKPAARGAGKTTTTTTGTAGGH